MNGQPLSSAELFQRSQDSKKRKHSQSTVKLRLISRSTLATAEWASSKVKPSKFSSASPRYRISKFTAFPRTCRSQTRTRSTRKINWCALERSSIDCALKLRANTKCTCCKVRAHSLSTSVPTKLCAPELFSTAFRRCRNFKNCPNGRGLGKRGRD